MLLERSHVAITGGAGGIGRLLCREIAGYGAKITVVDRVAPDHAADGFLRADLSTLDGIRAAADELRNRSVDVLVNLAGMQYFGTFDRQDPEHTQRVFTVNLLAPVILTQALVPGMKEHRRGHIVNIGSIFGSIAFAHFVTYSSSKAGLRGFSEALRRELAPWKITVTYVAPRAVRTPLNDERVLLFATTTGMTLDRPEYVARRIGQAIHDRATDVYIGFPESVFVRVNALMPRIVDHVLARNDRKASDIVAEQT